MNESALLQHFLRSGQITPDQLRIAQTEHRLSGLSLEQALLASGFISQSALRDFRSRLDGKAGVELAAIQPDARATGLVPAALARRYLLMPLSYDARSNTLCIAMVNAHDVPALDRIMAVLESKPALDIKVASRPDILAAIDRYYGSEVSIDSLLDALEAPGGNSGSGQRDAQAGTVVELTEALLLEAARKGASDMHFEPERGYLRIRYRIDGVLQQIRCIHSCHWSALLVRIKIISGLNIAETRAAQDGRFTQSVNGSEFDFRVSCFPSVHGESVVIRLLDRRAELMDAAQLGLPAPTLAKLRHCVRKPAGLIVMCGPTGSGKSTTLYSILNEIRCGSINIVTMEDPVEYSLTLLRQCAVNTSVKLDFAGGIRAILRQDPDVILVGETRDAETAEMVLRAALTGHLVLTTLHSQSALGALSRLNDLGLNLSYLAGNIIALVAQRLVRKLCTACRRAIPLPQSLQARVREHPVLAEQHEQQWQIYEAVGCEQCGGSAYQGRQAIVELYQPSAELNCLLASGAAFAALHAQLEREEHKSLAQQGIECVLDGTTSLQELSRVIDLDQLAGA